MQKIIPAILTDDPEELRAKLRLFRGMSSRMHIDIMDGIFVPSSSVSVRRIGDTGEGFLLDIHLMVADPLSHLESCEKIGSDRVFFHAGSARKPADVLREMERYRFQKGVALNPEVSVDEIRGVIGRIDAVQIMSVNPGAQGKAFRPSVLRKVAQVRALGFQGTIVVDGGVKKSNVLKIFEAGTDEAVVGSAIMRAADPVAAFRALERVVQ